MKAEINVTRGGYGFGHDWTLKVSTTKNTRSFYLGQDVKFCSRVLGMDSSDVVRAIGTTDINNGTRGNKKLAKFICETLGVNGHTIKKLDDWSLCCQ